MDTVQATVVTPVNVTPVGAQMNAEKDLSQIKSEYTKKGITLFAATIVI